MNDFFQFAHELADNARTVTLSYFRKKIAVDFKADASPVTVADKACETTLRRLIEARYPEHGILGEEQADKDSASPFRWIIDPIDGTRNFMSGMPTYGTLIALLEHDRPVLSIIDIPVLNERWSATRHDITCCNGDVISTRSTDSLANAIVGWTSPDIFTKDEMPYVEKVSAIARHVTLNGDCYLYGRLASGDIDVVLESTLKPFDYMPLILIVEQAGGVITDWKGNPLSLDATSGGQVLACANRALHEDMLRLLSPLKTLPA